MAVSWAAPGEEESDGAAAKGVAGEEDSTRGGLQRIAELFLGEQELRAARSVYSWCSRAEQICYGDSSWDARRRARVELKQLQADFRAMRAGGAPATRTDIELQRTFQEFPAMRDEPFIDMLQGMWRWLDGTAGSSTNPWPKRYSTFEDLRAHAYAMTGTVGLMLLPILAGGGGGGGDDAKLEAEAAELGIAVNLANSLQVVGLDAQDGALYLPLADLSRFGVQECDLKEGRVTPEYRELVLFQVERVRGMLAPAQAAAGGLQGKARLGVLAIARYVGAVLDEVVSRDCDNLSKPVRISSARKVGIMGGALWSWARLGLTG